MRHDIEPTYRMELANTISATHNVDGEQVVANVVHIGDKDNQHILSKMEVNDPDERIRIIQALGSARRELGVWPKEPQD